MTQNVHVRVRFEDQAYWATVDEYPGVFATGDSLEELRASLEEGLSLVIEAADAQERPVRLSPLATGAIERSASAKPAETIASSELTLT